MIPSSKGFHGIKWYKSCETPSIEPGKGCTLKLCTLLMYYYYSYHCYFIITLTFVIISTH